MVMVLCHLVFLYLQVYFLDMHHICFSQHAVESNDSVGQIVTQGCGDDQRLYLLR